MLPSNMQELAQFKNWIVSGADKIPWRVDGKARASSTDPNDWATYEEAAALCAQHPELTPGFVLTNTPYCCIDLDATDDASAQRTHTEIYNRFASCTEISMSGRGAHIWVKGTIPEGVRSTRHKVEVYSTDRYIKITGNVANSTQIMDRQAMLTELYNEIRATQGEHTNVDTGVNAEQSISDQQLFDQASTAANSDKFIKLWNGDYVNDYPSPSEADQALANILAFFTDNREQVYRMWKNSPFGQTRPKRNNKAWFLKHTVAKAFDQKGPVFNPEQASIIACDVRKQIEAKNFAQEADKYQDWTVPPGMVGEIAKFIYNAAYSPLKEVALAGAIAYYAGLMGRAYNVSGMGLNQYIVVLAKTGQGKEAAKTGISKINRAVGELLGEGIDIYNFMGPEMIASAQGLLNRISETPCCVSILPEFGLLLQAICDRKAHQNEKNIRAAFLKLYSSSGKSGHIGKSAYSDKAKNSIDIKGPAFSILGESTPTNFYKAVDEQSVSDGFLPRLTLIEYIGDSPEPNDKAHYVQPDPNMVLLLQGQIRNNQSTEALNTPINVAFNKEAEQFYNQLRVSARKSIDEHNRNNQEHFAEIWTRVVAKVIKLAALIAVGVNSVEPVITLADIVWAHDLVMRGVEMLTDRFKSGDVGEDNWHHEQMQAVEKQLSRFMVMDWNPQFERSYYISQSAKQMGVVTFQFLNANLRNLKCFKNFPLGAARGIEEICKALVNTGRLVPIERNAPVRGNRTGLMWQIVSL